MVTNISRKYISIKMAVLDARARSLDTDIMPTKINVAQSALLLLAFLTFIILYIYIYIYIQTTRAPQVHAGTYFLNRLQEDATSLHGCHIFPNKLQGAYKFTWGGHIYPTQMCHKYCAQSIVYILNCLIK